MFIDRAKLKFIIFAILHFSQCWHKCIKEDLSVPVGEAYFNILIYSFFFSFVHPVGGCTGTNFIPMQRIILYTLFMRNLGQAQYWKFLSFCDVKARDQGFLAVSWHFFSNWHKTTEEKLNCYKEQSSLLFRELENQVNVDRDQFLWRCQNCKGRYLGDHHEGWVALWVWNQDTLTPGSTPFWLLWQSPSLPIPEYPPESTYFSFKKRPTTTSSEYNTRSCEINSLDTSNSREHHIKLIQTINKVISMYR